LKTEYDIVCSQPWRVNCWRYVRRRNNEISALRVQLLT